MLWAGGLGEDVGFEEWDAAEAPGSIGELLGEVSFGCGGGLILVEELAAVAARMRRGSSEGRTAVRVVKPRRRALRDERSLPPSVRGPVEYSDLARLMSARSIVEWSIWVSPWLAFLVPRHCGRGPGASDFWTIVALLIDYAVAIRHRFTWATHLGYGSCEPAKGGLLGI